MATKSQSSSHSDQGARKELVQLQETMELQETLERLRADLEQRIERTRESEAEKGPEEQTLLRQSIEGDAAASTAERAETESTGSSATPSGQRARGGGWTSSSAAWFGVFELAAVVAAFAAGLAVAFLGSSAFTTSPVLAIGTLSVAALCLGFGLAVMVSWRLRKTGDDELREEIADLRRRTMRIVAELDANPKPRAPSALTSHP